MHTLITVLGMTRDFVGTYFIPMATISHWYVHNEGSHVMHNCVLQYKHEDLISDVSTYFKADNSSRRAGISGSLVILLAAVV